MRTRDGEWERVSPSLPTQITRREPNAMKQATRDALKNFLDSRVSSNAITDIWKAIDDCVGVRQREGKDAPELALRTSELLALLVEDITPDEYERAKDMILKDQSVAMDASIRVRTAWREYETALRDVRPLLGDSVTGMDSADIYRAGLLHLGVNAQSAPLDAARAMFRQMGQNRGKYCAPVAPDSPLAGASPQRKA